MRRSSCDKKLVCTGDRKEGKSLAGICGGLHECTRVCRVNRVNFRGYSHLDLGWIRAKMPEKTQHLNTGQNQANSPDFGHLSRKVSRQT